MPNRRLLLFLFTIVFLTVVAVLWKAPKKQNLPKVSNFEECAKAGYKVMESYPRQCTTKDGILFLETLKE